MVTYAKTMAVEHNSIKDDRLVLTNQMLKDAVAEVIKYFDNITASLGFNGEAKDAY